ncbi:MAG: hypothetical protein JNL97_11995, partial [Verrucomicrobiales bacterium]|nr:hypothetical protein [Verrucomicrobiales bacterium]
MSRNALGRGLGDLLHRARPSRVVDRATTQEPAGPHPSLPGLDPTPTPEPPPAAKAPTELARAGGASLEPAPSGPRSEPSTPASAPDAQAPSGIPRFGPAYAPAPEPSATPGRLLLGTVLAIDAALILFAAVVAF